MCQPSAGQVEVPGTNSFGTDAGIPALSVLQMGQLTSVPYRVPCEDIAIATEAAALDS